MAFHYVPNFHAPILGESALLSALPHGFGYEEPAWSIVDRYTFVQDKTLHCGIASDECGILLSILSMCPYITTLYFSKLTFPDYICEQNACRG